MDTGYGLIWEGSQDKQSIALKVNDDYSIIVERYGHNIFGKWHLEGIVDFRSLYSP